MTAMTQLSFSSEKFLPKTVYVTYIASTPEKVWEALTSAEFTKRFFFGRAVEVEPKVGGSFAMRMPDGRYDIKGKVIEWDPPRRLSVTWEVDFEEFRELPESLVTYDIEPMGGSVKLTMTEAHRWDVPDAILAGGRQGWPLILSSLKSMLETGKPIEINVKVGPPKEMIEAVKQAVATKPWRSAEARRT
jgi:uncharacterized protein YndB with AHSA1/START domain